MTDEQWRQLEWEDNYFSTIEKSYEPPRFDPFVEFDPPLYIIKECIKKLKQQSYELQNTIRRLRTAGFLGERVSLGEPWDTIRKRTADQGPETWLAETVSKIKSYEYRLKNRERTGSWEPIDHGGSIGEDQIRRAKEVPITSLYDGRLRRAGRNLVGICPFHSEKSGSFYIYVEQNRYHCFGCSAGGDSIDYIIARDGVDFITAVKYLNNVH